MGEMYNCLCASLVPENLPLLATACTRTWILIYMRYIIPLCRNTTYSESFSFSCSSVACTSGLRLLSTVPRARLSAYKITQARGTHNEPQHTSVSALLGNSKIMRPPARQP